MSASKAFNGLLFNFGIWLIVAGLCMIGWQAYEYFVFGSLQLVTTSALLHWLNISLDFLPASLYWIGDVLKIFPLSFALIFSGALAIMIGT